MGKKLEPHNLPEAIPSEKLVSESVFLRTVIKKDVYEKLKEFAQDYSTGRGDWDFGVAIQILLEHYEESKQAIQSEKLDMILAMLQEEPEQKVEEPEKKKSLELLGGHEEKL